VKKAEERRQVLGQARAFVEALQRMSQLEAQVLLQVFIHGCPVELPKNVHIKADFLRRLTGMPPLRCIRELKRLSSLGFVTRTAKRKHGESGLTIEVSFVVMNVGYDGPRDATKTVDAMIDSLGAETCCEECAVKALLNGDFSFLASAARKVKQHN
jgi:hypothetical protein